MNKESVKKFLEDHPAIAPTKLCKEAGLQPNFLYKWLNEGRLNLIPEKEEKLKPVLEKYGYHVPIPQQNKTKD